MITALTQETITPYASDAQTTQEPQGTDYTQGVKVGRTVPAKWWNWLFNAGTKRLAQSKNDAQDMLTEMQNVITDAGIALDGSDSTQLSQAVTTKADEQIDKFIEAKRGFISRWIACGTEGLLPPRTTGSGDKVYYFHRVHEANGVYFAVNRTYTNSGGNLYNVTNRIAFSYDLNSWHLLSPSDLGGQSFLDTAATFGAGVLYFKGAWYITISGRGQSTGSSGYQLLTRLPDLSDVSSKTVIYSNTYSTSVNHSCTLFKIGETLCWKSNNQSSGSKISISTDGISFSELETNIQWQVSTTVLDWCCPEVVASGGKYVLYNVVASADLSSWSVMGTSIRYASTAYLTASGGIVSGGTNYSQCYYLPPNGTYTQHDYTLRLVTFDGAYIILQSSGTTYVTVDFTNIVATQNGVINAQPIGNSFYVRDTNSDKILMTNDIMSNVWVDTGNTAPAGSYSVIFTLNGLPFLVDSYTNKFSMDFGATWIQAKDSNGNNYCARSISFLMHNSYFAQIASNYSYDVQAIPTLFFYTTRATNFVQNHTLHLC